jgi:phenylpyruvate tautomerase PptA (4-oxalocrotonate tautomerase family)
MPIIQVKYSTPGQTSGLVKDIAAAASRRSAQQQRNNPKDEKAAFIAAVFATMGELLGDLHHESYVYVHDVSATAYGFGGLTQERRYIAGKLGVTA